MASLIETTPAAGLLPFAAGAAVLTEVAAGPITSLAPFRGKDRAVSAALKPLGLPFPAPGKAVTKGDAACVWTGRGQAFLIGVEPPEGLAGIAALTDQSDAWVLLRLSGAAAEAVLARLVPLDLRVTTGFRTGSAARTLLGHMPLVIRRVAAAEFELMTFRSMAAHAVHELTVAMEAVAARG